MFSFVATTLIAVVLLTLGHLLSAGKYGPFAATMGTLALLLTVYSVVLMKGRQGFGVDVSRG